MSLAPEDFDGWDMARRNISYAPPLRRPQDTTPFPKKLVSGQKLIIGRRNQPAAGGLQRFKLAGTRDPDSQRQRFAGTGTGTGSG